MSTSAREMLGAERADIREFIATLTEAEWATPSLCTGWTVRDVVVHLIGPPDARLLLRHGPGLVTNLTSGIDRVNAVRLAQFDGMPTDELLAAYDAPRRNETPYGQVLTDKVIHHQDIRRPLGRPRARPPERLEISLRRVVRSRWVFGGRARAAGLRIEADDIDFAHGSGPLVRGAGEALLLALSGRPAAVDDLDGDGLATFAARVRTGHA